MVAEVTTKTDAFTATGNGTQVPARQIVAWCDFTAPGAGTLVLRWRSVLVSGFRLTVRVTRTSQRLARSLRKKSLTMKATRSITAGAAQRSYPERSTRISCLFRC